MTGGGESKIGQIIYYVSKEETSRGRKRLKHVCSPQTGALAAAPAAPLLSGLRKGPQYLELNWTPPPVPPGEQRPEEAALGNN